MWTELSWTNLTMKIQSPSLPKTVGTNRYPTTAKRTRCICYKYNPSLIANVTIRAFQNKKPNRTRLHFTGHFCFVLIYLINQNLTLSRISQVLTCSCQTKCRFVPSYNNTRYKLQVTKLGKESEAVEM